MRRLTASLLQLLIVWLACITALPAWAIDYVGGQVGSTAGITSALDVTFNFTGGLASTPAAGDLVLASWCVGGTADKTLIISNTGGTAYTTVGSEQFQNDDRDPNMLTALRVMPGTPETQVRLSESPTGGTGSTADGGAYYITAWRNVHATPLDVAAVQNAGASTLLVNPGAITPVTAGAYIVASGCGAASLGGTYTSGGDLTDFRTANGDDGTDGIIGGGYTAWAGGEFNAGVWSGPTDNVSFAYVATVLALQPAAAAATTVQSNCGALMLLGVQGC